MELEAVVESYFEFNRKSEASLLIDLHLEWAFAVVWISDLRVILF